MKSNMIKFVVMLGWEEGCGSHFLFGLSLYQIESTWGRNENENQCHTRARDDLKGSGPTKLFRYDSMNMCVNERERESWRQKPNVFKLQANIKIVSTWSYYSNIS